MCDAVRAGKVSPGVDEWHEYNGVAGAIVRTIVTERTLLRVTVDPKVAKLMDKLVAGGLYGIDRSECACRLMEDQLKWILRQQ